MDKRLHMLQLIINDETMSQRNLSKALDISLGTVNHMIAELEENHCLTMSREGSKKVRYTLTDNGLSEYNKLYTEWIRACFDAVTVTRRQVKERIYQLIETGRSHFYIQKDMDELNRLAKMVFMEISRREDISYELLELENDEPFENVKESDDNCVVVGWSVDPNRDYDTVPYKNLLVTRNVYAIINQNNQKGGL